MNSLEQFLNTLLADLDDLPAYLVENTKEYYESYFLDAKEEGLSDLDILERLGDPSSISSQIKLDYYLYQPKQTNQLFKKILKGLFKNKAALSTAKYITGFITFVIAASFYLVQLALIVSGIGVLAATSYVLYVDYDFALGTSSYLFISTGILGFSICMLISVLFKALSFWLRKLTINLIRLSDSTVEKRETKKFKPAILVYTILLIGASIFTATSPISKDLLYIWLSETPETYEVLEYTVDETAIEDLRINTIHANITVYYDDVEDIEIRYEKATYLNFSYMVYDGTLFINEADNGDIPFLSDFFARHPGTLELTIVLPNSMSIGDIDIYTYGSEIDIDDLVYSLHQY